MEANDGERWCRRCEHCGVTGGPAPPDITAGGRYLCRRLGTQGPVDPVTGEQSIPWLFCDEERAPDRWWRKRDRCGPDGKYWVLRGTSVAACRDELRKSLGFPPIFPIAKAPKEVG